MILHYLRYILNFEFFQIATQQYRKLYFAKLISGNNVPPGCVDGREIRRESSPREGATRVGVPGEAEGRRTVREVEHGQLRFQLETSLSRQDHDHVRSPVHQGAVVGSDRDDGAGGHDGEVLDLARSFLPSHRRDQDVEGAPEGVAGHE